MPLDLNCDLGEGEPASRTRALMRYATSVSIACGVHAGDAASMERCVQWAQASGTRPGAHPGLPGQFGRGDSVLTPAELETLLLHQVGALHRLTEVHRVRLHHVKLHGTLYHAVEHDEKLAGGYLATMARWFRGVPVYALAGGRVAALGREWGVTVWEEAFLDRAYLPDGSLAPRTQPGALWIDPRQVRRRLRQLLAGEGIEAGDGTRLRLRPRTVCIHSDSPGALQLLRLVRSGLSLSRPRTAPLVLQRRGSRRSSTSERLDTTR